jgi:hypothetical protein
MRRLHDYLRKEHKGKPEYSETESCDVDGRGWKATVQGVHPLDEAFLL